MKNYNVLFRGGIKKGKPLTPNILTSIGPFSVIKVAFRGSDVGFMVCSSDLVGSDPP